MYKLQLAKRLPEDTKYQMGIPSVHAIEHPVCARVVHVGLDMPISGLCLVCVCVCMCMCSDWYWQHVLDVCEHCRTGNGNLLPDIA